MASPFDPSANQAMVAALRRRRTPVEVYPTVESQLADPDVKAVQLNSEQPLDAQELRARAPARPRAPMPPPRR